MFAASSNEVREREKPDSLAPHRCQLCVSPWNADHRISSAVAVVFYYQKRMARIVGVVGVPEMTRTCSTI